MRFKGAETPHYILREEDGVVMLVAFPSDGRILYIEVEERTEIFALLENWPHFEVIREPDHKILCIEIDYERLEAITAQEMSRRGLDA